MKNKLLLTASALAFIMSAPSAIAAEENTTAKVQAEQETSIGQDIEKGLNEAGERISDAADNVAEATEETYDSIKAKIVDETQDPKVSVIDIDERMTAAGMIGSPVYNTEEERIAKVSDIILDRDGNAIMVILADGDFTGLGKHVAFEYDVITRRDTNGDLIAPLSEEDIDNAMAFSYDRSDYSDTVQVIPSNGFSVAELMDSNLTDPAGETLANVDNISFREGAADQLILKFNDVLGFGGETVAMGYDDLNIARTDGKVNFQLTQPQTDEFKTYKDVITQ